jgi:fucose 4-O-acetylase-like acetyltransferase
MLHILAVVTGTVLGIMVGVEFAVAVFVNLIFRQLPIGASIEARAAGGRLLGRVMPFWYFCSLALISALAAADWSRSAARNAAVTAAVFLALSVVLSVALLVPLNNRSVSWTAADHPTDWREQQKRWDRLHYIRVALIVTAFVLTLVATVA